MPVPPILTSTDYGMTVRLFQQLRVPYTITEDVVPSSSMGSPRTVAITVGTASVRWIFDRAGRFIEIALGAG